MKQSSGIALLELIIFIILIGIIASTVLVGMQRMLSGINIPRIALQANQLAQARMEIILQQRNLLGFGNFSDICAGSSPPAVCTSLNTFATNNGLTVNTSIVNDGTNYQLITVSVTGNGTATLQERVANYENPT